MKRINESNKKGSTLLAFALLPLAGFALDVYIPSLPHMAADLHALPSDVQLTLSIFLITYGVSQLFIGSLLDTYGRYWLSNAGLIIFIITSIGIAKADSINVVYLMRAIQGISVATIVVSKRTYFVDLYSGDKLKHFTSLFSVIWSVAPVIAPFIGGFLQVHFGWRANFYFLGCFGAIMLLLELLISGESIPVKQPFNFRVIAGTYRSMIVTKDFAIGMIVLALVYSMMMVYGMTSPFLIERLMHYPATVTGNASLLSGLSMLAGGMLSKKMITKPFAEKITITAGVLLVAAIGITFLTFRIANLYTLLAYVVILHSAVGLIFNTISSYLMIRFSINGGKGTGLAGGGHIIFTSLFSYIITTFWSIRSQTMLGMNYIILGAIALMLIATTIWVSGAKTAKATFAASNY